jgi:hypothetical protein
VAVIPVCIPGTRFFAGHLFATDFETCATLNRVWRSCFFGFLGGFSFDPLLVGLALVIISLFEIVSLFDFALLGV